MTLAKWGKRNCQSFEATPAGFAAGTSRLTIVRSITELPCPEIAKLPCHAIAKLPQFCARTYHVFFFFLGRLLKWHLKSIFNVVWINYLTVFTKICIYIFRYIIHPEEYSTYTLYIVTRTDCLNTWRATRVYSASIQHHLYFAAPVWLLADASARQPGPTESGRDTSEMVESGIRQLRAGIHVQLEQEITCTWQSTVSHVAFSCCHFYFRFRVTTFCGGQFRPPSCSVSHIFLLYVCGYHVCNVCNILQSTYNQRIVYTQESHCKLYPSAFKILILNSN